MAFKKHLSVLLAFKVIAIMPGLSGRDRMVLGVILDHYNQSTGRCDPSISRIWKLLGISERTVTRATSKGERLGLLIKVRHGGHFLCNQYSFDWAFIEAFEASWKIRKRSFSRTKLTSEYGQNSSVGSVNSVQQTFPTNQSNKTYVRRPVQSRNASANALVQTPTIIVDAFAEVQNPISGRFVDALKEVCRKEVDGSDGVFVLEGSAEWYAWRQAFKSTGVLFKGAHWSFVTLPHEPGKVSRQRGRYYPSQWPPNS